MSTGQDLPSVVLTGKAFTMDNSTDPPSFTLHQEHFVGIGLCLAFVVVMGFVFKEESEALGKTFVEAYGLWGLWAGVLVTDSIPTRAAIPLLTICHRVAHTGSPSVRPVLRPLWCWLHRLFFGPYHGYSKRPLGMDGA